MRSARWCIVAALVGAAISASHAKKSSFVRQVIVTSSKTPPPVGDDEWTQVPERRKLQSTIQHLTPNWRNFWLPVRFDETLLAADTLNIADSYRNRGYLEAYVASANLEPVDTGQDELNVVDIVIVVGGIEDHQRYTLTEVRLTGVVSLDSSLYRRQFRARHGEEGYFSPGAAEENLVALRTGYADTGFLDSTAVEIRQSVIIDRRNRTVEERYEIVEHAPIRVNSFRIINGDAPEPLKTDSSVIIQSLLDAKLANGSILGRQRILDAEANLADLGVFRRARVTPDSTQGVAAFERRATVDVAERDAWDIRARVGYSSIQLWRASESVYYQNFLGKARLLGQELQISRTVQILSFLYAQPRIAAPRFVPRVGGKGIRLRLDQVVSGEREIIDDPTRAGNAALDGDTITSDTTRTLRWKLAVSRRFGKLARLGISYDVARSWFEWKRADFTGTITLSGTYDSRDDFLNPTRGLAITAQVRVSKLQIVLPSSTFRPEVLVQYYRELFPNFIGAFSVGGGFYYVGSQGEFAPKDLFWRSVQTPTVRGATRNDITGEGNPATAYVLSKLEGRVVFWKTLGLVLFLDAGHAWAPTSAEEAALRGWSAMRRGNFALSLGVGPRIDWMLPIRLDFAYPITGAPREWKFEFGIGQAF